MMRFIKKISKLNYFTSVLVCQLGNGLKINMDQARTSLKPNILIAPLDWGLGHATRCIPIINALIQKNCNVIIACEGKIESLLFNEFPQVNFINFKGYRINYSKNSWSLPIHIGKQIPKIISTIQYENERLKEIVKEHSINGIISDNRYGFYHDSIPSVFITHQLRIKTGFGRIVDDYLQKLNYKYINRFSECWIPDNENKSILAGELSHPEKMPSVRTKYLGPLSRFQKINSKEEKHLLVLLSGPEPQRTIFENLVLQQLNEYKSPIVLVRGLPGESKELHLPSNICVYNHLPAEELNQKINEASFVVSRCGYSTMMDLAVLKKKSILVPTPGQTEQEYLAKHLMKNNFALCIKQNKFRLKNALQLCHHFNYQIQNFCSEDSLDNTVDGFLSAIKTSAK
jgi:uncharacterized protein (TIGR00661 family)